MGAKIPRSRKHFVSLRLDKLIKKDIVLVYNLSRISKHLKAPPLAG